MTLNVSTCLYLRSWQQYLTHWTEVQNIFLFLLIHELLVFNMESSTPEIVTEMTKERVVQIQ